MNHKSRLAKMLLCAGGLSLSVSAAAASMDGATGAYLDLGVTPRSHGDAESFTVGVVLPWSHGGQPVQERALSFYWDFFLSQWRAPNPGGADWSSYTQLGVIANWRFRLDQGASPWFVEAGLGGTLMDSLYRTSGREFSTTFQFTEQFGVGRSFGVQGEHELSLRLQHFSNAGIKAPNPGENFVRLRYLYRF